MKKNNDDDDDDSDYDGEDEWNQETAEEIYSETPIASVDAFIRFQECFESLTPTFDDISRIVHHARHFIRVSYRTLE